MSLLTAIVTWFVYGFAFGLTLNGFGIGLRAFLQLLSHR